MSLLPRPFSCGDGGTSRSLQSSIFGPKDPTQTAHFPPWYSGSSAATEIHKHLLQNRSSQSTWNPTRSALCDSNEFHEKKKSFGRGFNHSKPLFNHKSSGFHTSGKNGFGCDACNRTFGSQEELTEHVATHVKCPFGSCKFQAHPKVVALHQRLQHSTGLADKLISLDTPEAIRKWREERKRNFPTAANIERKKKEQAEKVARGEDLQNKYFGKMRGGKYGNRERTQPNDGQPGMDRGRGRGRKRHRNRGPKRPPGNGDGEKKLALAEPSLCQDLSQNMEQDTLNSTSMKGLAEDNSNDSNEEGVEKISCAPKEEKVAHAIGGSLSMLADYGSASDQEDEEDQKSKDCQVSRFPSQTVPDLYPTHRKNHPSKKSLSLLEKLLANEIRHERNVILQCVHYTVKKNFFDTKK